MKCSCAYFSTSKIPCNMKFLLVVGSVLALINISISKDAALETVSKHGQLSVDGIDLVDENGDEFQLKGMSLYWDVWQSQYYNKDSIDGIHDSCHSNVVRAVVMAETDSGEGYIPAPEASLKRLYTVIDAAIEDDIYVIVDWADAKADTRLNYSIEFFDTVSKKYGDVPNIIYETFNEPVDQDWMEVLKPYHQAVVETIRANDPDNVILLGTPSWCLGVNMAGYDPLDDIPNLMYVLRFYAGTHGQYLRDIANNAMNVDLPIFITGYVTVDSSSTEPVATEELQLWYDWLDELNLSYVNFAISAINDTSAALIVGTPATKVCQEDYLTESGKVVVAQNMA